MACSREVRVKRTVATVPRMPTTATTASTSGSEKPNVRPCRDRAPKTIEHIKHEERSRWNCNMGMLLRTNLS